uniref:DUF502 domain-containing protein n=1 Tax=candidate division WOR-3 bacterium TaxID=2052148 RepID=A0A7V3ZY01_UNCW3
MPHRFLGRIKDSFKKENIRGDFIAGLIVLGPLVLTLYILSLLISVFGNFFANLILLLPFIQEIPAFLRTLIGLIIGMVLIYLTGLSVRLFFGFELEYFINSVMSKIPVVNTIYNATRELVKFISSSQERKIAAGKVVLFAISDNGPFLMGFVTREEPLEKEGKKFYTVFSPTTPNPTTGFYLLVEEEKICFLDMDFNDAFKIIMTSGIGLDKEGGEKLKNGLALLSKKINKKD